MKIGIISFGSLVNQLENHGCQLQVKKPQGLNNVSINGLNVQADSQFVPAGNLTLPIRLGRISEKDTINRRVTMIVDPSASEERVFCAESKFTNLNEAIANLRKREGIPQSMYESIGYVNLIADTSRSRHATVSNKIKEWARTHHFDAVIWTDLPSKGINFGAQSTGREILPVLEQDPVLLHNTKKYIQQLPLPPNPLQKKVLALEPNPLVQSPEAAYKNSLIADFAQRDALPQTHTPRENWFHESFGTWGPYVRKLPTVDVPQGYDPVQWKRDRIVEVAKHYAGLPYKRADGMRGHFPDRGCGLDCSNFVSWVYNYGLGKLFDSHVDHLWENNEGRRLSSSEQPKKGDLVFYKGNPKHVVIYIDDNHIIDSTSACPEGVQVRDTRENRHHWCRPHHDNPRLLGFKRIIV